MLWISYAGSSFDEAMVLDLSADDIAKEYMSMIVDDKFLFASMVAYDMNILKYLSKVPAAGGQLRGAAN